MAAQQRRSVDRGRGVRVSYDESTFALARPSGSGPERRGRRRASAGEDVGEAVVAALPADRMEVVDVVELAPKAGPEGRRRSAASRRVTIDATVAPRETALLLVEQDGVLSWELPRQRETAAGPERRGRRGAASSAQRVTFEIEVVPESRRGGPEGKGGGIIGDLVLGRVKAWVIRVAARVTVAGAMAWLERKVRTGLVDITEPDPSRWRALDEMPTFDVPADRPVRLLLFVHGTFSSTLNSYGALGLFEWGRRFLTEARARYDGVLGYDHATLSVDPLQNAMDLLERLRATGRPLQVDTVSFSRGGLVVRSLVEHLLPVEEASGIVLGRHVMVGVPNGGTTLAEPKHWKAFLDLYTNLATAAFRVMRLAPQLTVVSKVLEEVVTGLSSFATYMAEHAVEAGGVPGLAAMRPKGAFIRDLNLAQAPPPALTQYFAITSDFRARLGGEGEPLAKELPRRLVMLLADGATAQLIRGKNDLVVNTGSMTTVGDDLAHLIQARHDFGSNPHVYHTIYFTRPEVVAALSRWLLTGSAEAGVASVEVRPTMALLEPAGKAVVAAEEEDRGTPEGGRPRGRGSRQRMAGGGN